jgi:hypothetical protein
LRFDRGAITPAYGTSGFRAGLPTSYSILGHDFDSNDVAYDFTIDFIPTDTENTVVYSVTYGAGE